MQCASSQDIVDVVINLITGRSARLAKSENWRRWVASTGVEGRVGNGGMKGKRGQEGCRVFLGRKESSWVVGGRQTARTSESGLDWVGVFSSTKMFS